MEREGYVCPVALLKDEAGPKTEDENEIRVGLQAARILPLAIGDTEVREGCVDLRDMMWLIDLVSQSLVWRYIRLFTGDTSISPIIENINCVENGMLLQADVHHAFRRLA